MDFAAKTNPTVPITAADTWIYYVDKLADIGSLGLIFVPAEKFTGEVKMSNYGQMTLLKYPPSTTSCRLGFFAYEVDQEIASRRFTQQRDPELAVLKTLRFWPEEKNNRGSH